jgi:hypothetical protein
MAPVLGVAEPTATLVPSNGNFLADTYASDTKVHLSRFGGLEEMEHSFEP